MATPVYTRITWRMPPEELAKADAEVNAWFNDHQTMLAESR
jgi:hypothetical protein